MRFTSDTRQQPTNLRGRSWLRRSVLALGVVAMLASSCSSDDDDAGEAASDSDAGTDTSTEDSSTDAEAEFDRASGDDDMADEEDDMAEEADESDDMAEAPAEADGLFDATADDDAGGLFAPEAEEPAEERLEENTFEDYGVRPFVDTDVDNRSTFALDVDTGSYTVTRRWLDEGVVPDPASVRVEEFVNAFDYDYEIPRRGLSLHVDGGPSPFDEDNVLVRVGVQAAVIDDRDRPPAALTFVVDTSGSMDRDDRLGLVKEALAELVDELDDADTVAIVTYGDRSAIILEPTSAADEGEILDAIDDLRPGGSTNLEAGLETAYDLAERAFVEGGVNRLILASDGVANVGTTDPDELTRRISDRAINGIQLVTVGFGMGNFNDVTMEQLADQGDGFYAYVDTRDEAERLFEEELVDTLAPIAIDGRIQVEFDADLVDEYRLIGFENRGVLDQDFRNDDVDAGELSSGHTVTALYELELDRDAGRGDDLGEVRLRWQDPDDFEWVEIDADIEFDEIEEDWRDTSDDFQLATTVAAWAEVLRGSPYADEVDVEAIAEEAERLDDDLDTDQSRELADLTDRTAALW
jgi:Ca-activated chloride channel family protein